MHDRVDNGEAAVAHPYKLCLGRSAGAVGMIG